MSEHLVREHDALLPHDHECAVAPAELSERDLEAVTSGKMDTPTGRQELAAAGGLAAGYRSWVSLPAFLQYRYEFWGQYGLSGGRRSG